MGGRIQSLDQVLFRHFLDASLEQMVSSLYTLVQSQQLQILFMMVLNQPTTDQQSLSSLVQQNEN